MIEVPQHIRRRVRGEDVPLLTFGARAAALACGDQGTAIRVALFALADRCEGVARIISDHARTANEDHAAALVETARGWQARGEDYRALANELDKVKEEGAQNLDRATQGEVA